MLRTRPVPQSPATHLRFADTYTFNKDFKSIRSFYLKKFLNLLSCLYICLHMILFTAWNHVHMHKELTILIELISLKY